MQDRISHHPFNERPTCSSVLILPADGGSMTGLHIQKNIHTAIEAGISGAAFMRRAGNGSATCHEETSNEHRPKDTTVR